MRSFLEHRLRNLYKFSPAGYAFLNGQSTDEFGVSVLQCLLKSWAEDASRFRMRAMQLKYAISDSQESEHKTECRKFVRGFKLSVVGI